MKQKIISMIALLLALLLLVACNNTNTPNDGDSQKEQSGITDPSSGHDNNTENSDNKDNTDTTDQQTNDDQQDEPPTPTEKAFMSEGSHGIFDYLLYIPENATDDMPLIVYLHGSSSHGDELSLLTTGDDLPKFFAEGKIEDVPAYILFPQLSSEYSDWIAVKEQLMELVNTIIQDYNIDENRVSLTGFSMGGTGTWNIAVYYPETFSCIAPLSGSIRTTDSNLSKLKGLKIWAFVGSGDDVINPDYSVNFVEAFKNAGGDAKVNLFDGAVHVDVPALAYMDQNIGLLQWLCSNSKKAEETGDGSNNMFENSDFIETEQPELDDETKALISLYKRDPSIENYLSLRAAVIRNYDAVLVRKEAKLAELKEETAGKPGGAAKVAEMEEIVQKMYKTYWNRINSSMLRFTDPRMLSWKIADATKYEYIPVMGAGESIYVKRTTVTNAEYAEYIKATGAKAPSNWVDGTYPVGEENLPVNYISFEDAVAYCEWLTEKDSVNTYRLPNESEWELAAGHMPKDALFNCGINDGRTPVEQYAKDTRGAHGAVDFWGNVWEWTTTVRSTSGNNTLYGVKGGAWNSARTDCRTEYRKEGRNGSMGYEDVGFRVIMVKNGEEPEQKVELATLEAPMVVAISSEPNTVELSWKAVDGANAYQLFSYSKETGLVEMLQVTENTFVKFEKLESGTTYYYIVQPISYKEIADNVSAEYSVKVTCK